MEHSNQTQKSEGRKSCSCCELNVEMQIILFLFYCGDNLFSVYSDGNLHIDLRD